MQVCDICRAAMCRETSTGVMVMRCRCCGNAREARPEELRVFGEDLSGAAEANLHDTAYRYASWDRTNQLRKIKCPLCGWPLLQELRAGASETPVYICPNTEENCQFRHTGPMASPGL